MHPISNLLPLDILAHKPNIRVLSSGIFEDSTTALDYTRVNGGLLVQERDSISLSSKELTTVSQRSPSIQEVTDLLFAWEVVKCVKSNAIVYAKDRATVGIGAGQMSRVFSSIIANLKS